MWFETASCGPCSQGIGQREKVAPKYLDPCTIWGKGVGREGGSGGGTDNEKDAASKVMTFVRFDIFGVDRAGAWC